MLKPVEELFKNRYSDGIDLASTKGPNLPTLGQIKEVLGFLKPFLNQIPLPNSEPPEVTLCAIPWKHGDGLRALGVAPSGEVKIYQVDMHEDRSLDLLPLQIFSEPNLLHIRSFIKAGGSVENIEDLIKKVIQNRAQPLHELRIIEINPEAIKCSIFAAGPMRTIFYDPALLELTLKDLFQNENYQIKAGSKIPMRSWIHNQDLIFQLVDPEGGKTLYSRIRDIENVPADFGDWWQLGPGD